jgi:hypothetical protein
MVARVRGARPGRHARGGGQGGARGRRPGRRAGARPRGHEARPGRRAGAAAREARGVGERRKKRKGRERGEGSSPRGSKSGDQCLQNLGHHGRERGGREGLSDEPTAPAANGARCQRSTARSTGDTWPSQRSLSRTGLSGVPRGPKAQRSASPEKEGDQAPDKHCSCPVVHRTVRCATRQKARIAF